MSKERMYGWNGELPVKEFGGQKAIVFRALRAEPNVLKTGHEWAETFGDKVRTKQDPYRVILYYILILKSQGLIRTNEFDINAVTRNESVKHGITVKTQAAVEERYSVIAPEQPAAEQPVTDTRFWPDDVDVNDPKFDTPTESTDDAETV